MGEILDRTGRIIKSRFFPSREPIPFNPSLDQLNDARATLEELKRAGAVSDFAATGMGQIIDKAKVHDPKIDVDALRGIGSGRIENLYKVVTSSIRDTHLEVDDRAQVEYALDLTRRAEAQAAKSILQTGNDLDNSSMSRRAALLGFGVLAIGAITYLISEEQSPSIPKPTAAEISTPELEEQRKWEDVLGKKVEVKPSPALVTPETKRNLEVFGFKLIYLPKLELGTIDDLKSMGEAKFVDLIEERYPKWKRYEKLETAEKRNYRISRNLEHRYWQLVKDEDVRFPNMQGQWIAVEKMPKPPTGNRFENTFVSERLGFQDRFSVSWNDGKAAIERIKGRLIENIGLPPISDMRMLEPIEWNLIANREGWGQTSSAEWTNAELRRPEFRLAVGHFDKGGAASAATYPPNGQTSIGFRAAVILDA